MAREHERERRALIIAKALMLGYTFHWGVFSPKGCYMLKPNGMYYAKDVSGSGIGERSPTHYQLGTIYRPVAFPALWLAAEEALKLSGVLDAKDVRRDTGEGSSKSWKLRSRRNIRGRSKSFFEGSGTS